MDRYRLRRFRKYQLQINQPEPRDYDPATTASQQQLLLHKTVVWPKIDSQKYIMLISSATVSSFL
jgi:hypothetical protein